MRSVAVICLCAAALLAAEADATMSKSDKKKATTVSTGDSKKSSSSSLKMLSGPVSQSVMDKNLLLASSVKVQERNSPI
jgi:hypothetical protein